MFVAAKTKSTLMKKIVYTLLCLCTLAGTSALTSCNKTIPPLTPAQQIVGKWTIETAIGNHVMHDMHGGPDTPSSDTTFFTAADFMQFNADGTLFIHDTVNEGTDSLTGKWKITNDKLYMTESGYLDDPSGFDISTLTNHKLQLSWTQSGSYISTELLLNLNR